MRALRTFSPPSDVTLPHAFCPVEELSPGVVIRSQRKSSGFSPDRNHHPVRSSSDRAKGMGKVTSEEAKKYARPRNAQVGLA